MKKLFHLILAFIMMLTLCGCQGTFGSVNLNEPMDIPEGGLIKESIVKQIKNENAIGIFQGESEKIRYEWTIFGSDIDEARALNLDVKITQNPTGNPEITLAASEPFGLSALLSVYLEDNWNIPSATGYVEDQPAVSVSITGSNKTILNMMLDGTIPSFVIRPDGLPEETVLISESEPVAEEPVKIAVNTDDYLSHVKDSDSHIYTDGETQSYHSEKGSERINNQVSENDNYLSGVKNSDNKVYTGKKDKYLTDPVPEGKPKPVEPEDQDINKGNAYTCTFSIECSTILNNLDQLDPEKLEMVPSGGVILKKTKVMFYEGESVYDVLQRVCKENGIHMESSWTPIYNSAYVEGIHNLYEFDCGALSGWMYKVDGWYPNYGCSRYQLKDGQKVEWRYTCDLGKDVGGAYAVGN